VLWFIKLLEKIDLWDLLICNIDLWWEGCHYFQRLDKLLISQICSWSWRNRFFRNNLSSCWGLKFCWFKFRSLRKDNLQLFYNKRKTGSIIAVGADIIKGWFLYLQKHIHRIKSSVKCSFSKLSCIIILISVFLRG
jgi:hypothetical protein